MHLAFKQNEVITALGHQLRGITAEIIRGLAASGDVVMKNGSKDIFAGASTTQLYLVQSGKLLCREDNKNIYIAEPGDLVGLQRSLKLPEGIYSSDQPIELVPFQRDQLVSHVNSSEPLQKHWAFFLLCRNSFFNECLNQEVRGQFKPATGFLHFDKGETIIRQGDQADCVYTLLEGSAEAYRDDVKVGDIKAEEIFGAMSVFTHQPRSASVISSSHCSVLAVKKDEFLDLVAEQPQVCRSLIEEMADKIDQLNKKLANLKN